MGQRVVGIDVARGVATLLMLQTHAYHAWVAPELHGTVGYGITRLLGTLPLPAFLLLAGAAVMLRVQLAAAHAIGNTPTDAPATRALRHELASRGLQVMAWGYAASAAYHVLDGGHGLSTLLRADVLHVIGLSIAVVSFTCLRSDRGNPDGNSIDPRRFALRAAWLSVACVIAGPLINDLGQHVEGPARFLVALFVDVPGVTRMPLLPLLGWFGAGVVAAHVMQRARSHHPDSMRAAQAGAPDSTALRLAAMGLLLAVGGTWATPRLAAALGGTFDRSHPAIYMNVIDLTGRALLLTGLCVWISTRLPAALRSPLTRLGRGSLLVYVFHIPFCYGRFGDPLKGRLGLAEASAWLLCLMAVSLGVVWLRDSLRRRMRGTASAADSTDGAPLSPSST